MHENIDTFEKLEPKLSYFSDKEKSEIKAAYEFASEHHFGQKRKSGEDYIIHPLNVAYILADMHADINWYLCRCSNYLCSITT